MVAGRSPVPVSQQPEIVETSSVATRLATLFATFFVELPSFHAMSVSSLLPHAKRIVCGRQGPW
jgi:hypothetical protein